MELSHESQANEQEVFLTESNEIVQSKQNMQNKEGEQNKADASKLIRITREIVRKVRFTAIFDTLFLVYTIVAVITCLMIMTTANSLNPLTQMLNQIAISILSFFLAGAVCFALFKGPLGINIVFDGNFMRAGSCLIESLVFLIPIVIVNVVFKGIITVGSVFLSVDAYNAIFSIISAFTEEILFCLFLTSVGEAFSRKEAHRYIALILVGLIFAAFHIMVYRLPSGAPNWNQLGIMMGLRIIFSLSYIRSKRISVPIFLHLVNNVLANLPVLIALFGGMIQ